MNRLLAIGLLTALPLTALAGPLWRGDFESGDLSQWTSSQMVNSDRLQVVTSPVKQGRYALKATVRQGDNPIGASGNRNELVLENLNPEGSESYYRWSTMFAPDYPSDSAWQVFTQWHQSTDFGSPPVEFDIKGEEIMLTLHERAMWTAPLVRGAWHDFIFHVKWSDNENQGFVELWYDGKLVLPKVKARTTARTYLKQGLYRDSSISRVGVVYHDGMIQGATLEDVKPPEPQPASDPPVASNPPQPGAQVGAPSQDGTAASGSPATQPSAAAGPSGGTLPTSGASRSLASSSSGAHGCSTSGMASFPAAVAVAAVALLLRRRQRVPVKRS